VLQKARKMVKKFDSGVILPQSDNAQHQNLPELISLQKLAVHLQVHKKTVLSWIASGQMPAPSRLGKRKTYRWQIAKINDWITAQESN